MKMGFTAMMMAHSVGQAVAVAVVEDGIMMGMGEGLIGKIRRRRRSPIRLSMWCIRYYAGLFCRIVFILL